MLVLESMNQVKQDVYSYLGDKEQSDLDSCKIMRKYNCPFPSLVSRVDQLMIDAPVMVEKENIDRVNYFIFTNT